MRCEVCPHLVEIEDALGTCQRCEKSHFHGRLGGDTCGDCPRLREIKSALKPCYTCEAGRLHGQISTDASPCADRAYNLALPRPTTSPSGVTALAPDVEDSLRIALSTIFSAFDPVEVLLLRHIMGGETFATFCKPLRELRERLGRYDLADDAPGFRSLAGTWADRMKRNFPPIEDLFKASVSANGYTHKRVGINEKRARRGAKTLADSLILPRGATPSPG